MTDIMELLQRRDEQGLVLLQEQYRDYCYCIIYHLLRDHEQAEEALSDVWLQVWNRIPDAQPANLRAYLAKTARNTAIHYIKHNVAQKRSGVTVLLDELSDCVPDPQWQCDRETLNSLLRSFVNALRPEDRRLFLRRYWYGDTIEELQEATGWSQSKITGVLFRIRNKLRKFLKTEGYEV